MATIVLDDFRNAQLGNPTHSVIDFDTDAIASSLLDEADANGGVTPTVSNVVDYADVNDAVVVHDEEAHASQTVGVVGVGIYDAANLTMASVTGDQAELLTVHKDTGDPATSPLAIIYDSATTGLPVTPNGGNITTTWAGGGILTI
jgi:hypothetical protein